jgi:hypothetical protein
MTSQNPFETEENLQFWFELNPSYILAKKSSFKNYIHLNKPQNISILQQLNMSYTQLTAWIGKHAILATSIFLILTSTVGVFAAEGLAPKEFKPSSILTGNNKSSSSSSSSSSSNSSSAESSVSSSEKAVSSSSTETAVQSEPPLVADNGYSVENLNNCGLSARFKKTVQRQSKFELQKNIVNYSEGFSKFITPLQNIGYYGNEGSGPGAGFYISCFDKGYSLEDFDKSFSAKIGNKNTFFEINEGFAVKKQSLSKKDFCTELVLTSLSCEKDITNLYKTEVERPEGAGLFYFMNYNNKTYLIEKGNYKNTVEGSLTLQFITASNNNLQTYSNQYFPNFKLVYPDSWVLKDSSDETTRTFVTLTKKDGNYIKFTIQPFIEGCLGGAVLPDVTNTEKFANGLNRYVYNLTKYGGGNQIYSAYGQTIPTCGNTSTTKITSTYIDTTNPKTTIYYTVGIYPNLYLLAINPNCIFHKYI